MKSRVRVPLPAPISRSPSTSLKALAGESRVEEVATTNMDELTENKTKQNQTNTIILSTTQY
jgi:hypothetical protein